MTYKYYKFPNKETARAINQWPSNISIFEIGILKSKPEVMDNFGNEIEPAVYLDGWHVNVCYEGEVNLDFLQEYEINVKSPKYTWFGQ
jgi:hypothetical protein